MRARTKSSRRRKGDAPAYPDVPRDVPGRWGSRWARLGRAPRGDPIKRPATGRSVGALRYALRGILRAPSTKLTPLPYTALGRTIARAATAAPYTAFYAAPSLCRLIGPHARPSWHLLGGAVCRQNGLPGKSASLRSRVTAPASATKHRPLMSAAQGKLVQPMDQVRPLLAHPSASCLRSEFMFSFLEFPTIGGGPHLGGAMRDG